MLTVDSIVSKQFMLQVNNFCLVLTTAEALDGRKEKMQTLFASWVVSG
jgi:hypothetical protein